MDRRFYLFLVLTLLGIAISPRSFAQPAPTAGPVIREIAYRGIEHFSMTLSDQFVTVVQSRVGEPYDPDRVASDKQALQELGWFAAVETATVPVEGGIRLFYQVVENVPVISVEHQGLARATPDQQQQVNKLLKTLAGQPFSKKTAEAATEGLLAQGIFYNAYYKRELTEGGVRLTYIVIENATITAIRFIGASPLTEEQLRKVMASKTGELLNQNVVSADAAAIRKAHEDEGYSLAKVADLNMSRDGELAITIFVPTISEIRITGNVKIPEATLRQQLTFKAGDYYNEKAINESLAKIYKLPLTLEVRAIPQPVIEKGALIMTFQISERDTPLPANP